MTDSSMREDLGAIFVYDSDLHAAAGAHCLKSRRAGDEPPLQHKWQIRNLKAASLELVGGRSGTIGRRYDS